MSSSNTEREINMVSSTFGVDASRSQQQDSTAGTHEYRRAAESSGAMQLLQRAATILTQQNPAYSGTVCNSSRLARYKRDLQYLGSSTELLTNVISE